jgi:hypothetical protein
VLVDVGELGRGRRRSGSKPSRAIARQASRSRLTSQSHRRHTRRIRCGSPAGLRRAARQRRRAIGLIAGIIALGLVGLCLRTVPMVLTNSNLVDQIVGPFTGIPVPPRSKPATVVPGLAASAEQGAAAGNRASPVNSQAKPMPKVRQVEVPGSGPGTYQAAKKTVRSKSSNGRLIRYDVRVEDGLPIDPDQAALLIQRVLDDERSWRGSRRWRFELAPVGQDATLHAYIVTPKTTDRLCAPYLTRGKVSCQNGNRVVLNAMRWMLGADSYGSDLDNYRRYLVNHEFGHTLGKRHVNCPERGDVAPVMLQQTKGLWGCRKNPWPLAGEL